MNHPSVFSWSLGNEWPQFAASAPVLESLIAYARTIDTTHFLTFVTGGAKTEKVSGLLDIIGTNWAMYQWYDPFTTLDEAEARKSVALLNRIHERFPDKPVVVTEFGGAESQAGWHNWGNVKWSEEYQARNVADSGRYALQQEWISGGCVWQFCDTRSAPSRFLAGRLHGWNAKGVVDGYRSPKLAFYQLQALFRPVEP
jgi:beta-glucuronidase